MKRIYAVVLNDNRFDIKCEFLTPETKDITYFFTRKIIKNIVSKAEISEIRYYAYICKSNMNFNVDFRYIKDSPYKDLVKNKS